ncbi:MAG: dihydropteroate synthase [Terrimicrobiaceae bacterium]
MIWRVAGRDIDLSHRGMIMGVLNITPDSFSDGGSFFSLQAAVDHGLALIAEGADIIDVGGESTRPGAQPVSEDEELRRVVPAIRALRAKTDCLLSIDTSKADVASAALDAGANIVNDITGLRGDPKMHEVAREAGAGVVIMHMQGTPRTMQAAPSYANVTAEVGDFFRQSIARAISCGLDPMSIALDPGIGFGKTFAHNRELLHNLPAFRVWDRPLVVGVSRKSFLGALTGSPALSERFWPGVAMTSFCRERGARILRVHDVQPNREALRMTEAILGDA